MSNTQADNTTTEAIALPTLLCPTCGGLLDEEDLFCANCGRPVEDRDDRDATATTSHRSTHSFSCGGCGASMSYDARERALRCPFCGSTRLTERRNQRVLSPRSVVPFSISQEQADSILRSWLGHGFWRPRDLARAAKVTAMQPVYVPYWVFQADTHTYWTADTSELPAFSRGDWRPLFGVHRDRHEGVLVGASSVLTAAETATLGGYDLSAAVPPAEIDLENATAEQFQVMRKYARPLAREHLETLEAEACDLHYVPGRCRNLRVNVLVSRMKSEPMLLPVWVVAYQYEEQVYRFLVNGQTGSGAGNAPVSWGNFLRLCGWIALALAGAAGLAALVMGMG